MTSPAQGPTLPEEKPQVGRSAYTIWKVASEKKGHHRDGVNFDHLELLEITGQTRFGGGHPVPYKCVAGMYSLTVESICTGVKQGYDHWYSPEGKAYWKSFNLTKREVAFEDIPFWAWPNKTRLILDQRKRKYDASNGGPGSDDDVNDADTDDAKRIDGQELDDDHEPRNKTSSASLPPGRLRRSSSYSTTRNKQISNVALLSSQHNAIGSALCIFHPDPRKASFIELLDMFPETTLIRDWPPPGYSNTFSPRLWEIDLDISKQRNQPIRISAPTFDTCRDRERDDGKIVYPCHAVKVKVDAAFEIH